MKNPLKTLYFDPALINLLRNQPALILKLAGQQRNFLQVVAHPDKMGAASTEYSAELNEAVDMLRDRERLTVWIEEYLQEISNAAQMKQERAVLRNVNYNLTERIARLESEKVELKDRLSDFEEEIKTLKQEVQDKVMSWLMYRRPFTKIIVPDLKLKLFLPEAQNIVVEIADEINLKLYFVFDWKTIRIMEGRRQNVEKQLANMGGNFRDKGILPGRKLPWDLVAGCIDSEAIYEKKMPLRQAYREVLAISPFLEIGKTLVNCSLEQMKRDPEPMVTFSRSGKITDLREFSLS